MYQQGPIYYCCKVTQAEIIQNFFLPENEKMIGKLFLHRPCTILRQNIVLLFALLFFYFFCNMRFQVPHICHTDLAITKIVMVC